MTAENFFDAQEAAENLMLLAPIEWEVNADALSETARDEIRRRLEGIAERAASLARYMDTRAGSGCGDQGHKAAVKAANKVGRILWVKGFGYNDYHDLTL
jgi:hypothetical protein